MTTQDVSGLLELADACERHARHHFVVAAANSPDNTVDLLNIDRGLECLERAAALRARASTDRKEG